VVEEAVDGRDALARLSEKPFDLVISDLIMPVLDGAGLYDELSRRHPDVVKRLVFITGDTLSPATRQFLKRAKRPVIEKPFVPDEARSVVRQALSDVTP
jgi:CheY-like chemotaxis protein